MSIIRTLAALASAASTIFVAYAVGHGLSELHAGPFVVAAGALVVALVLILAQVRLGRSAETHH